MAPSLHHLATRDYVRCDVWGNCYRTSNWYYWGRWVLAGVAIFFFVMIISLLLCARQRRRRGRTPLYGTGWMAPAGKYGPNQNQNSYQMYNQNQHQQQGYQGGEYGQQQQGYYGAPPAPPPAYGQYNQQQQPQYTGTTFQSNDGYYGQGQTSGVQPPQGTYNPQDPYTAPPGPPPAK